MRIIIIGFMGAGKTTIGKKLASIFNIPFYDLDELISKHLSLSISEIFTNFSEQYFRDMETLALEDMPYTGVIATGGGIIEAEQNRKIIKESDGIVIWLDPPWDTLFSRIKGSDRPLVVKNNEQQLYDIYQKRNPLYNAVANVIYKGNDVHELFNMLVDKGKQN